MAGRLSVSYFRPTVSVPCVPPSFTATSRMKPSSRSTSHTRSFSLEAGRSSSSRPARCALRMRVKRSATGSVMLIACSSPGRLDHSRDLAAQGASAEADAAHLELVQERPRPAAQFAAVVGPHLELGLQLEAFRLRDLRELGHL